MEETSFGEFVRVGTSSVSDRSDMQSYFESDGFEHESASNSDYYHIPERRRTRSIPKTGSSGSSPVDREEFSFKTSKYPPSESLPAYQGSKDVPSHRDKQYYYDSSRRDFTQYQQQVRKVKRELEQCQAEKEKDQTDRKDAELKAAEEIESLKIRLFYSLKDNKKFEEGEELYDEVVTKKELEMSEDPKILDLRQSFAGILIEQSKFERAESISREVWEKRKPCSGSLSEEAKQSHRQLCSVLVSLQRFEAAEIMHRTMYQKDKKDEWALENGDELCQRLAEQGAYEKAKMMQREVLEIRRHHCGPRDNLTIRSGIRAIHLLERLLATTSNQGGSEAQRRLSDRQKGCFQDEIEVLLDQIWATRAEPEPILDILDAGHKLGSALFSQGKLVAAEAVLIPVWEDKKSNLGADSISAMSTGAVLGKCWQHMGSLDSRHRAIDILHGIWLARQSALQPGDVETISIGVDLAQTYSTLSDWGSAEPIYKWIVDQRTRKSGREAPETVEARWNLGQILYYQGAVRNQEAEIVLGELYQYWKGSRPGSKQTVQCGHMLAHSLRTQEKKIDQALDVIREVFKDVSTKQDIFYLDCGLLFGSLLLKVQDFVEAERVLQLIWAYLAKGPQEERLRLRCGNLFSECLSSQQRYSEAKEILETIAEAQRAVLRDGDPEITETYELLQDVNDRLAETEPKEVPKEEKRNIRPRRGRGRSFW